VAVEGIIGRAGSRLSAGQSQVLGLAVLLVAIGGTSWLTMSRVIRGQVLSLRAQPFMESCRAVGVPASRQFFRHVLPNLVGTMVVYATLTVPAAILSESFLSFLGIGVREPVPSWGNLASTGLGEVNLVNSRWWLLAAPCLMIALTLVALNFVGDSLRARFDPTASRARW
jgi:ABC-type dipeptide/oligopeptide/nickel transport system permease subunit